MEIGWVSIIPILLAVILAFVMREVLISLLSGILLSGIILDIKNGSFSSGIMSISEVFDEAYAVRSILFCLLVGAFVYVIEQSGGVNGLVIYLIKKKQVVKSKKGAELIAYLIGLMMFIDATTSVVVSGVSARPLFDHFDISREKLAYITDSTSSPVAWLFPFNAAGAFLVAMIGTVSSNLIESDPMSIILATIPFQLYGIVSIVMVVLVILFDRGGSWRIEGKNQDGKDMVADEMQEGSEAKGGKARNIIVPTSVLVFSIIAIMFATGDGSIGIYLGISFALIFTGIYYVYQGLTDLKEYFEWVVRGMSNYLRVTIILAMAFAFSNLINELKAGEYIASLLGNVNQTYLPAMVFVLGAIMSFATGTSAGTVGILIPIIFPVAASLGISLPLVLGAIISGGLFGDHCSPISDSTILSSMIAEVDVMDHVTTQMPYAIGAAAVSTIGFLALGILG